LLIDLVETTLSLAERKGLVPYYFHLFTPTLEIVVLTFCPSAYWRQPLILSGLLITLFKVCTAGLL